MESDNLTLIIVAILTSIPPTLAALFGWRSNKKSLNEVHVLINSRMDALLKSSKAESKAEGLEIGRNETK